LERIMIAAAVLFVMLLGSLVDGVLWAHARRQARRWPPRRVVASVGSIEETF
jgi:hypothetical protein